MAKNYELKFKVRELSQSDFTYLANSGDGIYGNMLKNKVALHHSNYMNVEAQLTHKQQINNWIRKNANGLWYMDLTDQAIIVNNIANPIEHNSITFIYFEIEDDVIAFKMRWNE